MDDMPAEVEEPFPGDLCKDRRNNESPCSACICEQPQTSPCSPKTKPYVSDLLHTDSVIQMLQGLETAIAEVRR